jgi:gliding motility-associated-like protein
MIHCCNTLKPQLRTTTLMLGLALALLLPAMVLAQPQIQETFPARGSAQAQPCGPFGVRLQAGVLSQYENALVVRGSATGLRTRGELRVSAAGDSLLFTPAIPFAPGEEVTITLGGQLRSDGVALGQGHVWQTIIRPSDENLSESLASMQSRPISLASHFPAGDLEFLAWSWADLNSDKDQEGVLLVSSGGLHYLMTVARVFDRVTGLDQWQVRPPAACTTDNPVDLKAMDLDGNSSGDLVLLTLNGLQYWNNPGAIYSPNGAQAAQVSFPVGFHSRTLVCGDVDSDGDEDLVVFGLFGLEYLVIISDGHGNLVPQSVQIAQQGSQPQSEKSLPWPVHAMLKDADGDGLVDLIWTAEYQENSAYNLRLAKGRGDGSFEAAGIIDQTPDFSRGLLFGRIIDPWDDSGTPPAILNTTPDQGGGNLCGFEFDGTWPVSAAGCLTAPGLSSQSTGISVSNILSASQPELWYADQQSGSLTVCTVDAVPSIETLELQTTVAALHIGDFNFDGDGDLAVLSPSEATIYLMETPGGTPQNGPTSNGIDCGGIMDFGVREADCLEAALVAYLPFTNDGLLPSRILQVVLDDPSGVFSTPQWPQQWFSGGCLGPAASVMLPVNFTPTDTLQYQAGMTVTVDWVGAAIDGGDSTIICQFQLLGRGGIHRVDDGGTGIGSLVWTTSGGYFSAGAALDFGTLPALPELNMSTTVGLTNTGHFPVEVSPPDFMPDPFVIFPVGPRSLAPGQTQQWTVEVQPRADLVPADADSVDLAADMVWVVSSLNPISCLPVQTLNQNLSVRLLSVAPCLAPDSSCAALANVCAETDTVIVGEDDVFSYCLNQVGWTWPAAQPELRIVENPMSWLIVSEHSAQDEAWPVISLSSDLIGAEGGDLLLELRDANHPAIVRSFALTVIVEPSRPDLAIVDMLFLPMDPDGEIQQQHPFHVDVVVEVTRQPVQGAVMELEGGICSCGVDPLEKVLINLAEGQRDTIRFVVESCDENGECPFTACVEPPEGLDGDFDPDNNCFTFRTMVAENRAPAIEISNLVLTPDDPTLEPCQSGITLNEISGGMVQAFGVREENNLSFDVNSRDSDGDDTKLVVGLLPPFVTATATGDTMVSFSITPPEGTVTREVCEEFGPLVFQVIETSATLPETTIVEIPLYVKWEGPDLETSLNNVPVSAGLADVVRFNGRVRCLGYDAGPFSVDMWLENPDGMRVAGRVVPYPALHSGESVLLPQLAFNVDRPGEYCARISIIEGRDVNPENNSAESCFMVASGPFVVSPNVTTPNGDGHNDEIVFRFLNQTMQHPKIRIFELSGNLVYETENLDSRRNLVWNGRNQNGDPMPPGTYLYVVYDDGREFRTGTCGVVR